MFSAYCSRTKKPQRTRPVDMGDVARHATALAEARPERKDVRVVCEIPERVSLMVDGDDDLLHRAVFNLLLTRCRRRRTAAWCTSTSHPARSIPLPVGVTFDAGAVALSVSDSGPGIPVEIRDRLFDPFFTTKPGGSGLGLAVVQRAIDAHRGLVFLDSGAERHPLHHRAAARDRSRLAARPAIGHHPTAYATRELT